MSTKDMRSRLGDAEPVVLTGVTVKRGDAFVTVILHARGDIGSRELVRGPRRLTLVFPRGRTSLSFQTLPVAHPWLKQIHMVEQSAHLRLVFTLTRGVRYAMKEGSGGLVIQFRT